MTKTPPDPEGAAGLRALKLPDAMANTQQLRKLVADKREKGGPRLFDDPDYLENLIGIIALSQLELAAVVSKLTDLGHLS